MLLAPNVDAMDKVKQIIITQFGDEYNDDDDYVLDHWNGETPIYRRVMNDQAIRRTYMEAWVEQVASLWDAIGKPVDERRLNLYCKQLEIVPLELLENGIAYAIRNNTYNTVPTVGLIWEGIRKEMIPLNLRPGMDIAEMIEVWLERKFKACTYNLGGLARRQETE